MRYRVFCAAWLSLGACDDAGGAAGNATSSFNAGAASGTGAGPSWVAGSGGSASATGGSGGATSGGSVTTTAAGDSASGRTSGGAGSQVEPGTGGASGDATVPESPPGFFVGGYLTSAPWRGWVFTYADSAGKGTLVSPVCDASGCVPSWGQQPCMKGVVGQDAASSTFVGLAFHNDNPMSGGTGTWTVAGEGVYVVVSRPPPAARLQLQEPNTSSNEQRYCAALPPGGSGLIPFSSFKTYCWGDPTHASKALSLGTPIHETALVVPGNAAAPTPFDFCLVDIRPQ